MASTSLIATTRTNTGLNLNIPSSSLSKGLISRLSFTPLTNLIIDSDTDFTVSFQVTHNLYSNSIILITAPSSATVISSSSTCTFKSWSLQFDTGIQCSYYSRTPLVFQISNPFSSSISEEWAFKVDSANPSNNIFTLQINGVHNPTSKQDAGSWSVVTKNLVGGTYYTVDDSGTSTITSYTPDNGVLTPAGTGGLTISDRTTYTGSATYTFSITI